MKVEIIEEEYDYRLQRKVNDILSKYPPSAIFDIKYSTYCYECGYSIKISYTAMIIFK